RRLKILGSPRVLLPSQAPEVTHDRQQTSTQPKRKAQELVQHYPEFASGLSLLSRLPETSQVLEDTGSGYNPAVGDQLAFGRALCSAGIQKSSKLVPIVALVGGVEGELVRVFQLANETCCWRGSPKVGFENDLLLSKVAGTWFSGGSTVQQLRFAQANNEPTEWLAVRYSGATSILRVFMRNKEVPNLYRNSYTPAIDTDVHFRFELQHIVTVPVWRTGGTSHADLCFNPYDHTIFAIVDHSSRWSVWKTERVREKANAWTLEAGPSGILLDDSPIAREAVSEARLNLDGWAAITWIDQGNSLLVCNRKSISAIKLQDLSQSRLLPNLDLRKSTDWILDFKQSTADSNYAVIVTSSRLLWIHLTHEQLEGSEQFQVTAEILLLWVHFRSKQDLSLSIQIADWGPKISVLLYSRLTHLKTIYTVERGNTGQKLLSSIGDPYLLSNTTCSNELLSEYLTLVLKPLPSTYEIDGPEEADLPQQKEEISYLKLLTLSADLSLHECLLAELPLRSNWPSEAPYRVGRPSSAKHIRKSLDNFVVPDGLQDSSSQLIRSDPANNSSTKFRADDLRPRRSVDQSPLEHHRALDLGWLAEHIKTQSQVPFNEALGLALTRLHNRLEFDISGVNSLSESIEDEVGIDDIDQNSSSLEEFLIEVNDILFKRSDGSNDGPARSISLSDLIVKSLPSILQPQANITMSQTYDALVRAWIKPLARKVPGQIRSKRERTVRSVAAHVKLASYGLKVRAHDDEPAEERVEGPRDERISFSLPVRGLAATTNDFQGNRALHSEHMISDPAPSSQMSEDVGFMPAAANPPTPELTPSLHSQGSHSTQGEVEDPAIQRLRSLTAVSSQPPLPNPLTDILSHWSIGQNPDTYDWEASQSNLKQGDQPEAEEDAARMKKKRRLERMTKRQEANAGDSWQNVPQRFAASQADVPDPSQFSSQQSRLPASQPERGRFGKRTPAFKKRRSGFK
ncbi:MAG: hypothetical protein Q9174_004358, partial [Haloplaca sp. 1 TL-2023]